MSSGSPVVAAVTIGQSPRPDIVGDMAALLPGVTWLETGALDGMDDASIAARAPGDGDMPLVTRAGGRAIVVGEHAIIGDLQRAIDRVSSRAAVVLVLCAAELPPLFAPAPLVWPGRLLDAVAASLVTGRRLNVFVPHEGQIDAQRQRWHARRVPVHVSCVPPADSPDLDAIGRRASGTGDLSIMDCLGYTLAQQEGVRRAAGHPVLSARGIAARVLAEILG